MPRNGFSERFAVGCDCCGLIGHYPTSGEAWEVAAFAAVNSRRPCTNITICDRMAHRGQPYVWRHDGKCIAIKE